MLASCNPCLSKVSNIKQSKKKNWKECLPKWLANGLWPVLNRCKVRARFCQSIKKAYLCTAFFMSEKCSCWAEVCQLLLPDHLIRIQFWYLSAVQSYVLQIHLPLFISNNYNSITLFKYKKKQKNSHSVVEWLFSSAKQNIVAIMKVW